PNDTDVIINNNDSAISRKRFPFTGTSKMLTLTIKMVIKLTSDKNIYGMALLTINNNGFSGETKITSMVLISFSLTIATEVIIAAIKTKIMVITPGTKLYVPFNCGLYNIRN